MAWQTEQILMERLFQEITGYKKIAIATYKFTGGKSNRVSQPLKSSKKRGFFGTYI